MSDAIQTPLPEGWRWARLGDVCEKRVASYDPGKHPDKPFRYIDITSVDNQAKRITTARTLLGKEAPSRARQVIQAGDVLVSTTRPNLNAVAFVPDELDGEVCSTGFCVLRAGTDIIPSFLFAFVRSSEFVASLSELVKGALYPAVTDGQVRNQTIPLPPVVEQQRIADILTEQMAAVDRARAAAEAQLEAAEDLLPAFLRSNFISEAVCQWPTKRLGDILQLRKEIVHPRDNPVGHAIFVGLEHVESDTGARIGSVPVNMTELMGRKPRFYEGDIVYGYLRIWLPAALSKQGVYS